MTAGIAFAEADVTLPDGTLYEGVAVSTRGGVLRLRDQGGTLILELAGVSGTVRHSRKRWSVRFTDLAESATVLRQKCGCG